MLALATLGSVAGAAQLEVGDGVVVKLGQGAQIVVRDGLSARRALFTSINDDSAGGQIGSAPATPAAGDWGGVRIEASAAPSELHLRDATIRYGGDGLTLRRSSAQIDYLTVSHCGTGVRVVDGGSPRLEGLNLFYNSFGLQSLTSAPVVRNAQIVGNAAFGVVNLTPGVPIQLAGNWWGDASGPRDPANNAGGMGDLVSQGVEYREWLTGIPLLEPNVTLTSAATHTEDRQITLDLACRNAVAFRAGEIGTLAAQPFKPMASSAALMLSPGDGIKQVAVEYRASTGNTVTANLSGGVLYDTQGPVISITSPAAGSLITQAVTVHAEAVDPAGVKRVEVFVDDLRVATLNTVPYRYDWDLTNVADGVHSIKVVAFDALDRTAGDTRGVLVRKPITGNVAIDARATIYGAGQPALHDSSAIVPPVLRFNASPGKALTVSGVAGQVSSGTLTAGADGSSTSGTNITGIAGLSGIQLEGRALFLTGVFLTDSAPADPPPPALDLSGGTGAQQFAPLIAQVFFIGDGLTGSGAGTQQTFVVPPNATRLYLGFADAPGLTGVPGGYGDNQGVLSASIKIEENVVTDNSGPQLSAPTFAGAPLVNGQVLRVSGEAGIGAYDPSGIARVELLVDGALRGGDANGSDGYRMPLDLYAFADGNHELRFRVLDTLNNATELVRNVNVALAPPPAPVIASPASGASTNRDNVTVSGQAEPGASVQLYRDGASTGTPVPTDAKGDYSASIALVAGTNRLQARALNRAGAGPLSAEVAVTRDSTIPAAPTGLSASSQASGRVRLAWQRGNDSAAKGYHVYRAATAFGDVSQAARANVELVSGLNFEDLPPADGVYHYRVVAVNALGTQSAPSDPASAASDNTRPRAVSITYRPTGPVDAASGRIGRGRVDLTVRLSEAASATPFLSLASTGGGPIAVALARTTDLEYSGSFEVKDGTASGVAYAVFSVRDAVGNRGTDVMAGASVLLDAEGPVITGLTLTPSEPIKNDHLNPVNVTLQVTLSEAVKPGDAPRLSYSLSGAGRTPVAIGDVSQTGPTAYRARFTLPGDAGSAGVEQLQFAYAGTDDLGNLSDRILAPNRFQVYQGALPPVPVPSGLDARPLPAGKIGLTWNPVDSAIGYQLYRQAPGESDLAPYKRVDATAYTDSPAAEGTYRYAVASVRQANGEEGLSARSNAVEARADATPPGAPRSLLLSMTGAGVLAMWQTPPGDAVSSFKLYRSAAPVITSRDGLAPVRAPIFATSVVDPAPSKDERTYVVTAVDAAGNESPISNSAQLPLTLLPIDSLQVIQSEGSAPVLSWTHPDGNVAGYEILLGPDGLQTKIGDLASGRSFTDAGYTGDERRYTVVTVDGAGNRIGRSIVLPRLNVQIAGGLPIQRKVFNRLDYRVSNSGTSVIASARLKVFAAGHQHLSESFFLGAGETKVVPVVVGGDPALESPTALVATVEITPNEGESVQVVRSTDAEVHDGSLTLTVQAESLTRGGMGKVRFTLTNSSAVETQIVTARGQGQTPSDQIRARLLDQDGNVLASVPFHQAAGGLETYASGVTLARIAPGATFSSFPIDFPVPSSAPQDVSLVVDIDRLHYRLEQNEQTSIPGLSTSLSARLQDNAYYAEVTGIQPSISFGDRDVVINGRAIERRSNLPLASVPLKLVLAVDGFERSFDLFSDSAGNFSFAFTPERADAGTFIVSAIHPGSFERPDQGRFLVSRVGVSPTQITMRALRNATQPIGLVVVAAQGSSATHLRLRLEAADQPSGSLPAGLSVDLGSPITLGSGERSILNFAVTGGSAAADVGTLVLRVVYDEHGDEPLALVRIDYQLFNPDSPDAHPALYPSPSYLETSAPRDVISVEQLILENKGLGAAEDVTATLINPDGTPAPAWIALGSPGTLGKIEAGARTTVDISIAPTAAVPEGIYAYKLRVRGSNIQGGDVNLFVSVTLAGTGNVLFKSADFYTGTLDKTGKPISGLAEASIAIQNERVPDQRFTLKTDAHGEAYFADVPVGRYRYRATAPNHQEATGLLQVKPAMTVTQALFLNNDLVTVQWSVRETSVQDRYEISLLSTFETFVPAPVVLIEPQMVNLPKLTAGDVYYGELTVTNYGLIRAQNIRPILPGSDQFLRYEFLADIPPTLEAKQRIKIPYRIVTLKSLEPDGASSGGGCFDYSNGVSLPYDFECANGSRSQGGASARWAYVSGSTCGGAALGAILGGMFGGGGGVSSGGSGDVGGPAGGGSGSGDGFGGFPSYVPAYDSLPSARCVPGCNGKCCSAGGGAGDGAGIPAGGGAGTPNSSPVFAGPRR